MVSTVSKLCVWWGFVLIAIGFFPYLSAEAAVIPDDPGNFITTWNTENPGSSNDNQITIPGLGGGYGYEIYWEDTASSTINGTTTLITSSLYTLTFPSPGIYEVQASGTFPIIRFNNSGDKDKILTVEQWGDIEWTSMFAAFNGCSNLSIQAADVPNLENVTSMAGMFNGNTSMNSPLNSWDVSNVDNMSGLFKGATSFNQPLNSWDVSRVTNMISMFSGTPFNQDISDWNTSSTTRMDLMFQGSSFNQDISGWDVSNVTDMKFMFQGSEFNQDISNWDVSNVISMRAMFATSQFNQPLNDWDVSKLDTMEVMFQRNDAFNQPLNNWNTASTTNMLNVFLGATSFNQDISSWNTSNVTNMSYMFQEATSFDQSLASWDISSVASMTDMFVDAGLSTQNQDTTLTGWASQTLQPDVPFHLGLKSYSSTGAAALQTLRDTYNWTITEQYQAEYRPSSDAVLFGSSIQAPINSGSSTTAVELDPDNGCSFIQWSDGNTDNPRTDVLTDNLSVIAELECRSTTGTSASTQRDKSREFGNQENADQIEEKFLTTTSTPQSIETLEQTLERVKAVPSSLGALDPVQDRELITELISVLLELIQALTLLMVGVEVAS